MYAAALPATYEIQPPMSPLSVPSSIQGSPLLQSRSRSPRSPSGKDRRGAHFYKAPLGQTKNVQTVPLSQLEKLGAPESVLSTARKLEKLAMESSSSPSTPSPKQTPSPAPGRSPRTRDKRRIRTEASQGQPQHTPESSESQLQHVQSDEQQDQNPQMMLVSNYKTEVCKSFKTTGHCDYAEQCQFAHGVEELRPRHFSLTYKTQLCRNFHERGECHFSARCKFIHDEQRIQVSDDTFWLISPRENIVRVEVVGDPLRREKMALASIDARSHFRNHATTESQAGQEANAQPDTSQSLPPPQPPGPPPPFQSIGIPVTPYHPIPPLYAATTPPPPPPQNSAFIATPRYGNPFLPPGPGQFWSAGGGPGMQFVPVFIPGPPQAAMNFFGPPQAFTAGPANFYPAFIPLQAQESDGAAEYETEAEYGEEENFDDNSGEIASEPNANTEPAGSAKSIASTDSAVHESSPQNAK